VGGVLIGAFAVAAAVAVARLPASVPVDFAADGRPSAWSSASSLLLLPAFAVLLYLGLSVAQRFPHLYRYPFVVTPESAPAVYRAGRQIVLTIKILGTLYAGVIFYAGVSRAFRGPDLLSGWHLSAALIALGSVVMIGTARVIRVGVVRSVSSTKK
jgi:hypothetical protein